MDPQILPGIVTGNLSIFMYFFLILYFNSYTPCFSEFFAIFFIKIRWEMAWLRILQGCHRFAKFRICPNWATRPGQKSRRQLLVPCGGPVDYSFLYHFSQIKLQNVVKIWGYMLVGSNMQGFTFYS
jgi:hypothetical protein